MLRYRHKDTGKSLTHKQWEGLPSNEQDKFVEFSQSVKIVVCSLRAANGLHVPYFCLDECDILADDQLVAYRESKHIPCPPRYGGGRPLTLLISTRKFSWGIVQQEIDKAAETGLIVRHWNIIDVTEACPPSRHLPNEPRVEIYRSDDTLTMKSPTEYAELPPNVRITYVKDIGYKGCATCKLFPVCKTRLATEQHSTSSLLKPIPFIIQKLKETDLPTAKSQLLCRKPSESGLIYPYFNREIHMITADQMAERASGKKHTGIQKPELIEILKQSGADFRAGMDHGFSHDFAVTNFAVLGQFAYIFDVTSIAGLELDFKIEHCRYMLEWDPAIWPDISYPADNATFKRKGYRMREWTKGPDSVMKGIQICRTKMHPAIGEPTLFLLRDDPGCELLAAKLAKYNWTLDKAGRVTDQPSKIDDDLPDSFRYGIMNAFNARGQYLASGDSIEDKRVVEAGRHAYTDPQQARTSVVADYMKQVIAEQTGSMTIEEAPEDVEKGKRRGGIIWDV